MTNKFLKLDNFFNLLSMVVTSIFVLPEFYSLWQLVMLSSAAAAAAVLKFALLLCSQCLA